MLEWLKNVFVSWIAMEGLKPQAWRLKLASNDSIDQELVKDFAWSKAEFGQSHKLGQNWSLLKKKNTHSDLWIC